MPAKNQDPQLTSAKLVSDIKTLWRFRDSKKSLEESITRTQGSVLDKMGDQDSLVVPADEDMPGKYIKATVVKGEATAVDYERLLGDLNPEQQAVILREVVDPDLLADAMARGIIDPQVVVDCTTVHPRKPYVKVSVTNSANTGDVDAPETDAGAKDALKTVKKVRKRSAAAAEMRAKMKHPNPSRKKASK